MKRISKKLLSLVAVIAIVFSYFIPFNVIKAAVPADPSGYGIISIYNPSDVQGGDNVNQVIGTYEHGTFTLSGTGMYTQNNNVYANGDVSVDIFPEANYSGDIWIDGTNMNATHYVLNVQPGNTPINLDCVFEPAGQQPQGNTTATINVQAGQGTYTINGQERSYDDQIELRINGSMWDHEAGNTIDYDLEPGATTVVMTFETLWINRFYDTVVINNTSYPVSNYINFDDRTSWLEHNNGTQMVSFSITNVPKADNYDIVVKHGENNGTRYLATFLWTADPAQAGGHDYIGHAKLELVKAEYYVGDTTYTVTENDIEGHLTRDGDYMTFRSADGFLQYGAKADVDYDDGGLTLPGEATVTMRVVPEYGYQVTSVNGGSNFTTTDDGVSEFTVTVHHGEAGYFQATVEAVEDEVIANATEVTEGTVEIDSNEIDSGTVQLTVDNVDLDEDKIKDFENAANGNKILTYFDINLMQVLYRGTADSVWSNQIHRLDSEATISLKLDEGIDINDVVFVHNIDDGDEFEIIEIDSWDPKTRIVTFKTNSFSNFAIAEKPANKGNGGNPGTGDDINAYINMLFIGLIGTLGTLIIKKKKEVK
ncbi:MAG: hypothetical protein IJH20_04485 [Bacilli bacterium]|nr:hypothetical protein [Bacilli bacterium]